MVWLKLMPIPCCRQLRLRQVSTFKNLIAIQLDVSVEPKIGGKFPPNHPFVHRVFHDFHHPFWGFPIIFGNTHVSLRILSGQIDFRDLT